MPLPRPLTVIGLTGLAGTGKDTVAALLRAHCGASTLAFADALRAEIADAFCLETIFLTRRETKEQTLPALALKNCTERAFVDRLIVHHAAGLADDGIEGERLNLAAPRSPRQIMQWWGTEYRRAQDAAYWVRKAHQTISWLSKAEQADLVVLSDVRFANEAELVRCWGGQIWQVLRPGAHPANAHTSEATGEQFAPDAVIHNTQGLRELRDAVLSTWAAQAWGLPGVRVSAGTPAAQPVGALA